MTGIDAAIERIRTAYGGWRRDTPIATMRADWDRLFADVAPKDVRAERLRIGARDACWVRAPGADDTTAILYLHGGGFRIGSSRSHHRLAADLSRAASAPVLLLDYRLMPEHPFPAAIEDTLAAWQWLVDHGHAPGRLAIAGDSAGANLALTAMLRLRDTGGRLPAAAYLLSAWTDLTASGESFATRADADPIHSQAMIRATAAHYLDAIDPADPVVSPLFARLAGLPPLLLQVGDRETVLSDSVDFAERARGAGVDATAEIWPGMIHVFQQFPDLLPEATAAIERGGTFLHRHLTETHQ